MQILWYLMSSKELKSKLEALLEVNDKKLFKGLNSFQNGNTARQKPGSVLKKKGKSS